MHNLFSQAFQYLFGDRKELTSPFDFSGVLLILKNEGFFLTKDGSYMRKDDEKIIICSLQQNKRNTRYHKSFTWNIALHFPEIYKDLFHKSPPPVPEIYDCQIRIRIGQLMKKGDYWYTYDSRNKENVEKKFQSDFHTYMLPFLKKVYGKNSNTHWLKLFETYVLDITPIEELFILEKYDRKGFQKIGKFLYKKAKKQNLFPIILEQFETRNPWIKSEI